MNALTLDYNPAVGAGDLVVVNGQLAVADELQTLVYTSLFTDARASANEAPGDIADRRGYWGDAFTDKSHGSLLWLLEREKITADTQRKLVDYINAALLWLVTAGKARAFTATVERRGLYALAALVTVTRPNNTQATYEYPLVAADT